MSGNYPPGVTGNEWQIAGYPEGVWHGECQASEYNVAPLYLVETAIERIRLGLTATSSRTYEERVYDVLVRVEQGLRVLWDDARPDGSQCDWEGDVDAVFTLDTVEWECPRCGTAHEDERPIPEDDREED